VTGTVTISSGGNVNKNLCGDFTVTATGVTASDYVLLLGPSNAGWSPTVVSTATNSMVVRLCNNTSGNANPNGFTLNFLAIH
jgi:hypothetical protein